MHITGYAEQAGELGDRESALVAQLRHPAARRLEPGRRGAGPTRPPAAGPSASRGPLPGGRRAAVRPVGTVASEGNVADDQVAGFREQAAGGIGDDAQVTTRRT